MAGRLVNDRLENICEEAIITKPRYFLGINRDETEEKHTSLGSQCPRQDWNQAPPRYKSKASLLEGPWFVYLFVFRVCQPAVR
jgi:hypothetical protein